MSDSFTAVSSDGSQTKVVTVTINGTNDVPVISGVSTGVVTEDATTPNLSTSGLLTIVDVDQGQSNFTAQASIAGSNAYGTFTLAADGNWTYSASNSQTAIQQLGAGQSLSDSFTAVSSDGSKTQLVTMTINGTNDAETPINNIPLIGGDSTGAVTEDATTPNLATAGLLSITDADLGQSSFAPQVNATGTNGFGTFTLAADGNWTYSAVNSQTAIQQLGAGQSLSDSFTAVSSDGSKTQLVTVTINGTNDVPVAKNDTPTNIEDTVVIYTSAQLLGNDTDVDGNPLTIASVLTGTNGAAVLNHDGTVTFTPTANFNGAANFSYIATDGKAQSNSATVTVNVAAVNDAPELTHEAAILLDGAEDTNYTVSADELLADFTDVDFDSLSVIDLVADFGIVVDNEDGTYTISPDANYNGSVNLTYNVFDGIDMTPANQSFNLAAVNDAPTGSVIIFGSAIQSQTLTATNSLADSDGLGVIAYQWLANGTVISGATGATLLLGDTLVGKAITAQASYTDQQGTDEKVLSAATEKVIKITNTGTPGSDDMQGSKGDDVYVINNPHDRITEDKKAGTDTVVSSINYTLAKNLENLTLSGTKALSGTGNTLNNTLIGNKANNVLDGGKGADKLMGGLGNDSYYVDNKGDKVTEEANAGTDKVISSISYVLGANLENLTLIGKSAINGAGNALKNTLLGNAGANALSGLAGDDLIFGGLGKDKLTGGLGKDTFDFNTSLEIGKGASRDAIWDFTHSEGDKIDLSGIDANSSKAGNQVFSFIGSKAFGGKAGELSFINGILSADTDGKNGADLELSIKLVGTTTLVIADFVL